MGDKIKELRRKEGRTQEALAKALGVTSQAVSRNEGYIKHNYDIHKKNEYWM